jgi:hypothetical protein
MDEHDCGHFIFADAWPCMLAPGHGGWHVHFNQELRDMDLSDSALGDALDQWAKEASL